MSTVINALSDVGLVEMLGRGGVGVLPTDTVYGLVCVASDLGAVSRLYGLKSREHKPGTVIAASIDQLVELGIKARYLKAVEQFWPNAISIEVPHTIAYLNQNTGRQAFRVIRGSENLLELLHKVGPLLTSSANQPTKPPANTVKEAQNYFGDQVDFYVDGGDLSDHKPSTVIRIVDDAVEILRHGAVKINEATGRIVT